MTADTAPAWPDPNKPGVPLHPERDGWHWLEGATETPAALEWRSSVLNPGVKGWYLNRAQHGVVYAQEMTLWRYLGPCLLPSEVQAREAAAFASGAEAMREASLVAIAMLYNFHDAPSLYVAYEAIEDLPLPPMPTQGGNADE